jgi:hypothetical protein
MNPFAPSLTFSRRRFMQGAAAAGALSLVPWRLQHALAAPSPPPVLSGTEFQLEIGALPLTINGRQAVATSSTVILRPCAGARATRWRFAVPIWMSRARSIGGDPSAVAHGRRAGPSAAASRPARLLSTAWCVRAGLPVPQPFDVQEQISYGRS